MKESHAEHLEKKTLERAKKLGICPGMGEEKINYVKVSSLTN